MRIKLTNLRESQGLQEMSTFYEKKLEQLWEKNRYNN